MAQPACLPAAERMYAALLHRWRAYSMLSRPTTARWYGRAWVNYVGSGFLVVSKVDTGSTICSDSLALRLVGELGTRCSQTRHILQFTPWRTSSCSLPSKKLCWDTSSSKVRSGHIIFRCACMHTLGRTRCHHLIVCIRDWMPQIKRHGNTAK